jgi:IPT/TIG domain
MTILRRLALVGLMLISVSITFTTPAIAAAEQAPAGAPLAMAGGGFLPAGTHDSNTMPAAVSLSADPSQTADFSAGSDLQLASLHTSNVDFRATSALAATPALAATSARIVPPSPKDRLMGRLTSQSGTTAAAPRLSTPSISCNSTWNVVSSPNSGTGANFFASISGAAANDVWGVGGFINGSGVAQTLAEHWNGSAWSIVSTPNTGAGDNVLESVVAIASNDAWAVGYSRANNSSARQSLTEHWNGTVWSVVANPQVASASNILFAVAAIAGNDVWAVGRSDTSTSTQITAATLAMHWNGTAWALSTATPSTTTTWNELVGVRFVTSTDVWAVGDQQNFGGTTPTTISTGVIEHWNGTVWSQAAQAPDNANGDFLSDVAGTATDLWAVGGQFTSGAPDNVLIEHSTNDGATWAMATAPTPDLSADLFSLAYISGTNVYAVGLSAYNAPFTSSELDHTLVEQWNGSVWAKVPSADASTNDVLVVVAAISPDDVWADGQFVSGGIAQTLTENFCTPPAVTSLSPNSGPAAGGTSVVITGTGFTGATAVDFGTTAATTFHVDSDTQITATSPAHPAGAVDVTVTVQGTSATSTADLFTYVAPTPVVTSISPTSGPTAGGTSVTITGTGLLFATSVKFGTVSAASITSNTDTQIVAVSPAEAQSTVDVTVTTAGGTSATSSADRYSFVAPLPVVTAINPTAGSPAGGTSVTITGTGLSFATAVTFGSTPAASITSNTDTQIVAVSPAGTLGTTVDVTVTTAGGTSATSAADRFTYNIFTSYFNWFDRVTPGMVGDNIHLLNTSGATATISLTMPGASIGPFPLQAGQETYVSFGAGHIGGPVVVTSNQQILASQRVQYFNSFNEVWSETAAQASLVSYIPWYDTATAGMVGDNIHVLNPGAVAAHVTVSLAGATSNSFTLAAGAENYITFGAGHIGGPVTITSDQPVLGAQRIQYYQSFNEEAARPASAAQTTSYFHWFDRATAGMVGDNIHVLNTSGSSATVTLTLPGAPNIGPFALGAGQETYVNFGVGHIGGPVTVSSTQPVLASQRVQYFQSFNEVPQASQSQAKTVSHIMWFDRVTSGMVGDNIHVLNEGTATANVTISLAGASNITFALPVGGETYVTFGPGHIGGPVTITADQPVLAAQRVQYFQSFNEVTST